MDTQVIPTIHRLVCKFFHDSVRKTGFDDYCRDVDKWIDCWIGCANVVVQNRKRVGVFFSCTVDLWYPSCI
jgi:hypothetical protein